MPRPSKYSKKLSEKICEFVRNGATRTEAAEKAGIDRMTLWNWSKSYSAFFDALSEAEKYRDEEIGDIALGSLKRRIQGEERIVKKVKKVGHLIEGKGGKKVVVEKIEEISYTEIVLPSDRLIELALVNKKGWRRSTDEAEQENTATAGHIAELVKAMVRATRPGDVSPGAAKAGK